MSVIAPLPHFGAGTTGRLCAVPLHCIQLLDVLLHPEEDLQGKAAQEACGAYGE